MSTKLESTLASTSLIQTAEPITNKLVSLPFQKVWRNCVIGLQCTIVLRIVWNLLASIGFLCLTCWKKQKFLLFLPIPNIQNRKKETRLTERMRNGFATCSCMKWLNLRQCLNHNNELEKHLEEIEWKSFISLINISLLLI